MRLAIAILVPVATVAIVVHSLGGGGSDAGVPERATAICSEAQQSLEGLPSSPTSVAQGVQIERRMLTIFRQQVTDLRALGPDGSASFRAGVAADEQLLAGLTSIMARPDFVRLSLTLPGHPDLVPGWLRVWQARQQDLVSTARGHFSRAGVPACAGAMG